MKRENKLVVITGCSNGIGLATTNLLSEQGYTIVAGVRKEEDKTALLKQAKCPERILPIILDITNEEHLKNALNFVEKQIQQGMELAGIFSNAGIIIFKNDVSAEECPTEQLRRVMEVDFFASVRFVQTFLSLVRRVKATVIVNTAMAACITPPFLGGYVPAKCAMAGWTNSLRIEVAPLGVKVVAIEAAGVSTNIDNRNKIEEVNHSNIYPMQKPFVAGFQESMSKGKDKASFSPLNVAKAVQKALEAKNPKVTYIAGAGCVFLKVLSKFPDAVKFIVGKKVMEKLGSCKK